MNKTSGKLEARQAELRYLSYFLPCLFGIILLASGLLWPRDGFGDGFRVVVFLAALIGFVVSLRGRSDQTMKVRKAWLLAGSLLSIVSTVLVFLLAVDDVSPAVGWIVGLLGLVGIVATFRMVPDLQVSLGVDLSSTGTLVLLGFVVFAIRAALLPWVDGGILSFDDRSSGFSIGLWAAFVLLAALLVGVAAWGAMGKTLGKSGRTVDGVTVALLAGCPVLAVAAAWLTSLGLAGFGANRGGGAWLALWAGGIAAATGIHFSKLAD